MENAAIQSAKKELIKFLNRDQMITNPVELIAYEIDAALVRGKPDMVVYPRSTEEVSRILHWAGTRHIPVIAWGAGTGLAGASVAERGGIIMHFSSMDRLLEFDKKGRSAVVQPGMVNQHLAEKADAEGLYFPPDPASGRSSTIGGNIAASAGGPHCFKYGVTTNYLTGLEVVLADGQIIQLGGKALDYPELDFTGIFTGSEGTLGMITKAFLRLIGRPPGVKTMMAAFDTDQAAGEAVSALIAHGLVPATMEFMDQKLMRIIEEFIDAGLPVESGAVLIIDVDGYFESLSAQVDEIETIMQDYHSSEIRIAQTQEEREKIWYGRKSAAGAMARLAPAYLALDVTVPRSKLAQMIANINLICTRYEIRAAYLCHAGDGNLHPLLLIEQPEDKSYMERIHQAGGEIMQHCTKLGGSITGEHGIGIEKREFLPLMYSEDEITAMLEIKDIFDPQNILNPGKVFPEKQAFGDIPQKTRDATLRNILQGNGDKDTIQSPTTIQNSFPPYMAPDSARQAQEIIRQANQQNTPIHIQGGSSKSQTTPENYLILSTAGLNKIVEIAPEDLYVTVGAGISLEELQSALFKYNMWVPMLSPWKISTLGGIAATNFNAPLRMRYGGMRDITLAMQVIRPDGRMLRLGRPVVKNAAGYDMPKLFIGSQGTLGLITEITLKLVPLPRSRTSIIIPFNELEPALKLGGSLVQTCLVASALLLTKDCSGIQEPPYQIIYTAEGYQQNVKAELDRVKERLESQSINAYDQVAKYSGSEVWGNWVGKFSPGADRIDQDYSTQSENHLLRFGLPPLSLGDFILENIDSLHSMQFIADIPNGMLYVPDSTNANRLLNTAVRAGGYGLNLFDTSGIGENNNRIKYKPASLELMHKLKSKWDPAGIFNPA